MTRREAAVRGTFYPQSCAALSARILQFDAEATPPPELPFAPRAVVVPHAGYMYSGYTAAMVYRTAAHQAEIERVIVIGPSHRVALRGASAALFDAYETPCGDLQMDVDYTHSLQEGHAWLGFAPEAHHEHSTEVQIPLIAHYLPQVKAVEIVYGSAVRAQLAVLMTQILQDPANLLVISTDLSHFYTLQEANRLDHFCLEAVARMEPKLLDHGCEACGIMGLGALLEVGSALGYASRIIDYRTSADASHDPYRVVGYLSAVLG